MAYTCGNSTKSSVEKKLRGTHHMSFIEWWVSLFVLCGTVGWLEVFLFGK